MSRSGAGSPASTATSSAERRARGSKRHPRRSASRASPGPSSGWRPAGRPAATRRRSTSGPRTSAPSPERPPGVGRDDPDVRQPLRSAHEPVRRDVGEAGGDDVGRRLVAPAERAGDVLGVDDQIHQGIHRAAAGGPPRRRRARPQLLDELVRRERPSPARRRGRSPCGRSCRAPAPPPAPPSATVSRVVTVRWATTSRTVHAAQSEGVAHSSSSRSATWSASRRRSAATASSISARDSDGALTRRP